MQPVYDKLLSCERVLFALPLFFLGPPALAKSFIDRGQALWVKKYVLGDRQKGPVRKGFLFSVCGFKGEGLFACNISIVRAFFSACGIRYTGQLLVSGVDRSGEIVDRLPAIEEKIRELLEEFNRT
jgi:multimeric flavodoxin WrbA